jgi:predicted O-methyltransferase YrrM
MSLQAKTIVEAGTYRGRTAIALAKAMTCEGVPFHIWTAETDAGLVTASREAADANGVGEHISFYHGDYLDMLEQVPDEIDLAFIDGGYRYPMAVATRDRLSDTGLIVVDDMDAPSHWSNQEGYWGTRNMSCIWMPAHRGIVIIRSDVRE